MSLKDMRDELRALRKEHQKPVSRMKKADCAAELEKLRGKREETPPVASVGGEKKPKKMVGKIDDVKVAKEREFPTKPAEESKKKSGGKKSTVVGGSGAVGEKSKISKDMLRKMIDEMSDDE
jgi:hypothetical protein